MDPAEINKVFDEAGALKDKARSSLHSVACYGPAADKFAEAARLAKALADRAGEDRDRAAQCLALESYYYYESYNCRAFLAYETGFLDDAAALAATAQDYIQNAVEQTSTEMDGVSIRMRDYLKARKIDWGEALRMSGALRIAVGARQKLTADDIVGALDAYRELIHVFKEMLDYAVDVGLSPERQRIAAGNLKGAMSNAANATAFIALRGSGDSGSDCLPPSVIMQILRNSLDAYQMAHDAFQSNPAWRQYLDGADSHLGNIEMLLRNSRPQWSSICAEFSGNSLIIGLMRKIDSSALSIIHGADSGDIDCDPSALVQAVRRGFGLGLGLVCLYGLLAHLFRHVLVLSVRLHLMNVAALVVLACLITVRSQWRKVWWWKGAYPIAVCALAVALTIGYTAIPNSFVPATYQSVPDVTVRLSNSGKTTVFVMPRGDFELWYPEGIDGGAPRLPGKYQLVSSVDGDPVRRAVRVVPKTVVWVRVRVMNAEVFGRLLKRGDADFEVIFRRNDGSMFFTEQQLPFTEHDVRAYYLSADAAQE